MPAYRYKAISKDGKPLNGVLEARDPQDARYRVEGRGWRALEVQEAKLPRPRPEPAAAKRRSRAGVVALVLVLLAACATLAYLDPWSWFPFLRR